MLFLAGVLFGGACGGEDEGGGEAGPFQLTVTPEFVQGIVPGEAIPVLVSVTDSDPGSGEVSLAATFPAGIVSVEPERVAGGQIAEVTLTADAVSEEVVSELRITATRGSEEHTATREVIVMPFENDRAEMATDVLELFTAWLQREHSDLGITSETRFDGAMIAPRLLVVSHYLFMSEAYELGIAWHVMVAPDDWAELYLRPRDDLAPTRAFRLSSWSAALAGEPVNFVEVVPPQEVVR
jgi:hypothetical protein